jgi:MOSC domain-containing protein YiiM
MMVGANKMEGKVFKLQIARLPGAPMTSIAEAHLVPGKGIVGDRFFGIRKSSGASVEGSYEVTLIAEEDVAAFNVSYPAAQTEEYGRRNIVIRGCDLQKLANQTFRIGDVLLRGIALPAVDCHSPEDSQRTVCTELRTSILGAQILTEGAIYVGDTVQLIAEADAKSEHDEVGR